MIACALCGRILWITTPTDRLIAVHAATHVGGCYVCTACMRLKKTS